MGKGYAEGSAVEERLAALERGDDSRRRVDAGRGRRLRQHRGRAGAALHRLGRRGRRRTSSSPQGAPGVSRSCAPAARRSRSHSSSSRSTWRRCASENSKRATIRRASAGSSFSIAASSRSRKGSGWRSCRRSQRGAADLRGAAYRLSAHIASRRASPVIHETQSSCPIRTRACRVHHTPRRADHARPRITAVDVFDRRTLLVRASGTAAALASARGWLGSEALGAPDRRLTALRRVVDGPVTGHREPLVSAAAAELQRAVRRHPSARHRAAALGRRRAAGGRLVEEDGHPARDPLGRSQLRRLLDDARPRRRPPASELDQARRVDGHRDDRRRRAADRRRGVAGASRSRDPERIVRDRRHRRARARRRVGLASRKFGTTCDNIVSLGIVTADGRYRTCNATQNADLFWACRGGGGGNFGVVTALRAPHPRRSRPSRTSSPAGPGRRPPRSCGRGRPRPARARRAVLDLLARHGREPRRPFECFGQFLGRRGAAPRSCSLRSRASPASASRSARPRTSTRSCAGQAASARRSPSATSPARRRRGRSAASSFVASRTTRRAAPAAGARRDRGLDRARARATGSARQRCCSTPTAARSTASRPARPPSCTATRSLGPVPRLLVPPRDGATAEPPGSAASTPRCGRTSRASPTRTTSTPTSPAGSTPTTAQLRAAPARQAAVDPDGLFRFAQGIPPG